MRKLLAPMAPLLIAAATLAALGDRPELLARFARFHVSAVEVRGARYVDAEEVRRWIPVYQDERGGARSLEGRLRTHELIEEATVRTLPGDTAEIVIRERRPVALVASPTLNPVDPAGDHLPIDPALHRLDLPLLRPMDPGSGTATVSKRRQIQAMAAEVHRLGELRPDFARSVSEVAWTSEGTLRARFSETDAVLHFRPPLSARRLREGLAALADAVSRAPERTVTMADLRFRDQVVVRRAPSGGPGGGRP